MSIQANERNSCKSESPTETNERKTEKRRKEKRRPENSNLSKCQSLLIFVVVVEKKRESFYQVFPNIFVVESKIESLNG